MRGPWCATLGGLIGVFHLYFTSWWFLCRSSLDVGLSQGGAERSASHGKGGMGPAAGSITAAAAPRSHPHPVWGTSGVIPQEAARLLLFLCQHEADRLQVGWSCQISQMCLQARVTLPFLHIALASLMRP